MTTPELSGHGRRSPLVWVVIGLSVSLCAFTALLLFLIWKGPRPVPTSSARDLYELSLEDWKHLTGTFTFGSGESKAELDEIIRQSLALW